jgi:hypothetical protein
MKTYFTNDIVAFEIVCRQGHRKNLRILNFNLFDTVASSVLYCHFLAEMGRTNDMQFPVYWLVFGFSDGPCHAINIYGLDSTRAQSCSGASLIEFS